LLFKIAVVADWIWEQGMALRPWRRRLRGTGAVFTDRRARVWATNASQEPHHAPGVDEANRRWEDVAALL
jgi:hypothetical protein